MKFLRHLLLAVFMLSPALSNAQDGDIDTKMQKLAAQLAERIRATGKNRVGVADFNDLQNNVPELGKFLAENLQGELVNNQLRIVNRHRIEQLLIENKLTAQKLLDPENALTLGKAAGMEVIVTGTITPLDERIIVLNVLALDVQGAVAIASAKTSIIRTPSINDLLRTVIGQASGSGTESDHPSGKGTNYEKDIPEGECKLSGWGCGNICFSNRFNEPLLLYRTTHLNGSYQQKLSVLIAPGAEGCSTLLTTFDKDISEYNFYFQTTGATAKQGFITLTVNRGKSRHLALSHLNFNLEKGKASR